MEFLEERKKRRGLNKLAYSIKLWWKFGVRHGWYDFKCGVRNVIRWMPHVWKYRDWDGSYTIDLLIESLEFHKARLRDHSNEVEEDLIPKILDITKAIALLKKYRDESSYTDHIDDHFDKLHGESKIYFQEIPKTQEHRDAIGAFDDKGDVMYLMKSTREDQLSEEEYEKYTEERSKMREDAMAQREADKQEAFKLIADKIDGWWE